MVNIIVSLILIGITFLAINKIVTEKRKGTKCIGCPLSGSKDNKSGCSC